MKELPTHHPFADYERRLLDGEWVERDEVIAFLGSNAKSSRLMKLSYQLIYDNSQMEGLTPENE